MKKLLKSIIIMVIVLLDSITAYSSDMNSSNAISYIREIEDIANKRGGSTKEKDAMVLTYIREDTYNSVYWQVTGGKTTEYFNSLVDKNGNIKNIKTAYSINMADGSNIDIVHLSAAMNLIVNGLDCLGGWGGDIVEFASELKQMDDGGININKLAFERIGSAYSRFNKNDILADIDAVNIMRLKNTYEWSIADSIEFYYEKQLKNSNRYDLFLYNTIGKPANFDKLKAKYNKEVGIDQLEQKYNIYNDDKYIYASLRAFYNYVFASTSYVYKVRGVR